MLEHNKDLSIFGGTFTDNSTHTTNFGATGVFDLLKERVAHRAFHNSGERFDAPKCHPRTRVAVLERIMEWIWGREDCDALIMWLYGPAGAGKSSIAQSIAEKCHELGTLLATFFFSKSDGSRNNAHNLIPTLAYQVALHIPETRERIAATILNDPLVLTKSLPTQLELLLIKPLHPLIDSGYFSDPNSRRLIIIDGLDECHDSKVQQNIVEQISNALKARKVPIIFLIASRPETHLSVTFNHSAQTPTTTRLALDDHYQPEQDIRVFPEDSFTHIRTTHPRKVFFPSSWPSPNQVEILVYKASGQFIYAATVVKYVGCLQHSPVGQLEVILGLQPPHNDRPFAELDALYNEIFLALDEPRPVLQILGFRNIGSLENSVLSSWFSSVDSAASFLSIKPSDVFGYMTNISALVTLKLDPNSKYPTIEIHHKSLMEFLEDPSRAATLYLDPKISAAQVVHGYLRIIEDEGVAYDSDLWRPPQHMTFLVASSLEQHCRNACMTEELREHLMQLSIPKFINFFLRHATHGSLGRACEVLKVLMSLSPEGSNIPDHQSSLKQHLSNLLEPYFSSPKLTSLFVLSVDPWNMCGLRPSSPEDPLLSSIVRLNRSLYAMDEMGFWFSRGPLEWSRSNRQHLKPIMPSIVAERKGHILATLTLHLLEFLSQEKFPQDFHLRKTDYDSRMMRNAPWRWRRRVMATRRSQQSMSDKDGTRPERSNWCIGCHLYHMNQPGMVYVQDCLPNLIYVLGCLPTLLRHADENSDLITFASRNIFPQQAFRFPRLRKRAQKAVDAYLAKFASNPPPIPPPEHFGEGPNGEGFERNSGSPWCRIFNLFPHFLALLVYICFVWITCFA